MNMMNANSNKCLVADLQDRSKASLRPTCQMMIDLAKWVRGGGVYACIKAIKRCIKPFGIVLAAIKGVATGKPWAEELIRFDFCQRTKQRGVRLGVPYSQIMRR